MELEGGGEKGKVLTVSKGGAGREPGIASHVYKEGILIDGEGEQPGGTRAEISRDSTCRSISTIGSLGYFRGNDLDVEKTLTSGWTGRRSVYLLPKAGS